MYRSIEELNGDCDPDDVVHLAEVYAFIIEDRDGGPLINSQRDHDGAVFVPGKLSIR